MTACSGIPTVRLPWLTACCPSQHCLGRGPSPKTNPNAISDLEHVLRQLQPRPSSSAIESLLTGRHFVCSGMLPGHLAGHYTYDECHVDLSLLATFAKARLVVAKAENIDLQARPFSST